MGFFDALFGTRRITIEDPHRLREALFDAVAEGNPRRSASPLPSKFRMGSRKLFLTDRGRVLQTEGRHLPITALCAFTWLPARLFFSDLRELRLALALACVAENIVSQGGAIECLLAGRPA